MDIGGWLRGLGLGRYETAFRENAVDAVALRSLTAEDLRDIGVTAVGDRRKLLDAIAAFRSESAPAQAPRPATERPSDVAERRQVTVMFVDLVGSTALSARLDPEDMREIISAYQRTVADAVRRFDGFVAKYMGDGVLAYFGYPRAHEDDAERAVRAGLEAAAAVAALEAAAPLAARVGIATGMVVVGDLVGSGEAQERGIVGETPNQAARLQQIAEAGMVALADGTRRLLGDLFEFADLGLREMKGMEPLRAWGAIRAKSVESRFEALHATLTALVGRDEEMDILSRRWARTKGGEGQVVLLSGEPGIGKSRLTAALLDQLSAEPHTRLRYFCSPQHTDSPFHPIIGQLERASGLTHDDAPETRLAKLDTVLAQTATSAEDAALFADLLSLEGRAAPDLPPEERRRRTLDALVRQVEALARRRPVLMVFEDAHWADPTSLESVGRVVDRIEALPVLLVATFRPEFDPPWLGRPYVTALSLNRLARRDVAALIDRVLGGKTLPSSLKSDILERTDGVPLFVEEMTKAVLEAGSESAASRLAAATPTAGSTVPASLHASLMARLDRIGPAKEVAQVGAAIGREFSHALVAAAARKPEAELGSALDRLVSAGLLYRQGVPPHATYLFKHALVQDAAYGTLLRESRRALHARIAEILEGQFPEIAERQPELLARHCAEAGLTERAAALWAKAGQRSLERSALVEAIEHMTRASAQLAALPATPERRREQIRLQIALITPIVHVKGYASPETKTVAERARQLIEEAEVLGEAPDDPLLLFLALYGFWVGAYVAFNGDAALQLSDQVLTLAEGQAASGPRMIGRRIGGVSSLMTGAFLESRRRFDEGLALYDPAVHRALATRFSVDTKVSILSYRPWTLWSLGYPDAALADVVCALREAREIGQAATSMYAQAHAAWTYLWVGEYAAAKALLDDGGALADEKQAKHWQTLARIGRGCLAGVTGEATSAVDLITSGMASYRETGATVWTPLILPYLARAYADLGRFDDAWRTIDEGLTAIDASKERWSEAEVHRAAGEIALMSPASDAEKAEACFERALAIARGQEAKSWELRAATSLARLCCARGERRRALDLLGPVYGWFTEGLGTRDLKDAKARLDDLSRAILVSDRSGGLAADAGRR